MKRLIRRFKYLYRTNWFVRGVVQFSVLYFLFMVILILVTKVFNSTNFYFVLLVLFMLSVGITNFFTDKHKPDKNE